MAKKKNHRRQNFKYGESSGRSSQSANVTLLDDSRQDASKKALFKAKSTNLADLTSANLLHVKKDVVRVAVLAIGFVMAEFLLWLAFNHSSLGPAVYHLIKI